MRDDDLRRALRDFEIPEPGATAERDARLAARAKFMRAREESEKNRQGNPENLRRMNGTTTKWRFIMSVLSGKHKVSLAVLSLTGIAVAIGVTMHATSSLIPVKDAALIGKRADTPVPAQPVQTDALASAERPPAEPALMDEKSGIPASPKEKTGTVGANGSPSAPGLAMSAAPYPYPYPDGGSSGASSQMTASGRMESAYIPEQDASAVPAYSGEDKFPQAAANPVKLAQTEPVSTFSIDVDTAAYAFVRRELNGGQMPAADAVRIEEMVNYFDYSYALPESKKEPFKPTVALYPSPWNPGKLLMHIGIKGYDLPKAEKPRSNLVFLIDTSGSMESADRLPLIQSAFKLMLGSLRPDDTIGIVTYSGNAGIALEPTKVSDKGKIIDAIDHLTAGGSTAGAEGIATAYKLAEAHFDKEGVNRVLLATDGDFNIGVSDEDGLKQLIAKERDSGIFLSVLGVGQGNYHDTTMQALAQNGNGTASYLDSLSEARKVLVEEASSTLFTIAKDVKLQVEFNPKKVAEYRLLGYETRMLKREDFNNDKVDAGDVGSGHAVTAIYEVTPVGSHARAIDDLRYGTEAPKAETAGGSGEYAFLKIRYKLPKESTSHLITRPITEEDHLASLEKAPDDIRFAASVAGFGLLLKNDSGIGRFTYDDDAKLAAAAKGADASGYRGEFVNLIHLAGSLDHAKR